MHNVLLSRVPTFVAGKHSVPVMDIGLRIGV